MIQQRKEPREVNRRSADWNHDVVTVESGDRGYCDRPCKECPWRRENAGSFPAEAFRISAPTAYDMANSVFGCHMSGTARPKTCAGFILRAPHNFKLRLMATLGQLGHVDEAGTDLFDDYAQMAEANGVSPDDPVLAPVRRLHE